MKTVDREQQIVDNVTAVRERIAVATGRAGRSSDEITLIAGTTTHPTSLIKLALAAGLHDCGESRVQEAEARLPLLRDAGVRWHLIGHLEHRQADRAVTLFDMIHSVDSLALAETLNRLAAQQRPGRRLPILLHVNVSDEASKQGFGLAGGLEHIAGLATFVATVEQIVALPQLDVQGLMTIAPASDDPEDARTTFRTLRRLRDELARRVPGPGWHALSMGMTDDFEVAIEEGATLVLVGRAIFGARP